MDREHPRGRTLMVRDGKRDKVKLDEFTAAIETAKTLAETTPFQTVYAIDEPDVKRTIGQASERCCAQPRLRVAGVPFRVADVMERRSPQPFGCFAWNLPGLRHFVHRENANPSKTYSHVRASKRG